jgi:D-alanyl-D-alanine carboxypeptidase/D-alanyl-D-alanine-endopeptidase (penicillin-binding protein 4)
MPSCRRPQIVALLIANVLAAGACTSAGREGKLEARLDEVLRRGQTGQAHYTARVLDLQSGRELYAVDADAPYMPASNGKLAPSAATLDFFGSKTTFKTYLARDGEDLWLIGTGDPGIGDNPIAKAHGGTTMTVLDNWADALKKLNVQRVRGNLYYYDREFDNQLVHPSWSKSYITDWYAAPISGLNFNNNCIDISVKPTSEGKPVTFSVIPPTAGVKVENKCVTGKGEAADVEREINANNFTITGATTRPVDLKSEAITNPGAFFADALRTHLQSKGIVIDGEIRRAAKPLGGSLIPPAEKIVAVHETALPEALARINKQSQNNFAEGFCKLLGRGYRLKQGRDEAGSWTAGAEATKAFLQRNRIDTSQIRIVDGSGLSRDNRVTSRMITDLFRVMWNHPDKQTFFDSLTVSGTDGTIKGRLKDLKGRVHGKTGFIGGVRSLSGYLQNDAGKWLAFSIIFNGIGENVKPYEEMQDNAVRVLAAWPKRAQLPTSAPATTTTTTTTAAAAQ